MEDTHRQAIDTTNVLVACLFLLNMEKNPDFHKPGLKRTEN
jgi:hypothetical protein